MRKLLLISLFFVSTFSLHAAHAVTLPDNVKTLTLSNGMRVIAITNRRIAAVSHMVWYNVGALDELKGKSGVAHYLEHLMFKETDTLKRGEFSRIVARNGGNDNAFTTQDNTAYFQNIASQHLSLVMSLEANRMTHLALTQENILTERAVVLEERSSRIDNNPSAVLGEKLRAALFGTHPYAISTIGTREEIENLTLKDTQYIYNKYYRPDNAILVVSGDIDMETLKPLAEKYYGVIPRPATTLPKRPTTIKHIPTIAKSITIEHKDSRIQQPEWSRLYSAPSVASGKTQHAIPLLILSQIIGGSDTGRLYKSLVMEKRIATAAYAYYSEMSYGPSNFVLYAIPTEDTPFSSIEDAFENEIQKIIKNGITAEELQRAKNILEAESIYSQDGLQSLGYVYGRVAALGLPLTYVKQWDEIIQNTTITDVQNAAKHIFLNKNHLTGYLTHAEETENTHAQ